MAPAFTSLDLRTGPSAYGQLADARARPRSPRAPRTRARWARSTSSKNAQRLTNLTTRLDEYLRFGLEAGVVFVT